MAPVALQAPTPTPTGIGPDELAVYWPSIVRVAWFAAGFLVVTLVGWYVVEPAVSRVIRRRNPDNRTLNEALSRYVRVLVVLVAALVGAGIAGYGRVVGNSALVVAAGTLAVGVAAQAVIGSLVSGLVLVLDPEFNVGDYVRWADREGTIRSITLRVTRVETPDGELVTVPNTVLTSEAITRPFGRDRHRVTERVGIDYDDDADAAMEHLTAAAAVLDDVLAEPAPSAAVDEFAPDAVVVRAHYWVSNDRAEDPNQRLVDVRAAYAREVKSRLEADGITISPPSKRDLQGRVEVAGLD